MVRIVRRAALVLVVLGTLAVGLGAWVSGYRVYVVHTGSMEPTYSPGSVVIDGPAPHHYLVGQVITFRHSASMTDVVTHRIVDLRGGVIHTKGDANPTPDSWTIHPKLVRGLTVATLPGVGYAAVFLRQPAGVASIMTTALAIFLLWGLFFAQPSARTENPEPAAIM